MCFISVGPAASDRAFYYSTLSSVSIGDGVTSIGDFAFYSCPKLGDLNNDGKVDVADHVKLSEIIMNQ